MNLDTALTVLAQDLAAPLDVAEVALHLARDEYPQLDVDAMLGELRGMAREARQRMHGPVDTQFRGLCRYLFHDLGFRGNIENYYDPRNSYLNEVLDRRLGIPITLSVIAMAVGARAGVHVVGVGLPGHFIAKLIADNGREQLFDPFHGGRLLTPEECEALVHQAAGIEFQAVPDSLRAVPTGLILQRMLSNLKGIYLQQSDFRRAARVIGRLRQLTPDDPLQTRDLGASLLHAEEPGRAIDLLQEYLQACPKAEDAEAVGKLLRQAREAVARWN
jgi:regulator of sirC expression with transglutaminase-like and TPR domain